MGHPRQDRRAVVDLALAGVAILTAACGSSSNDGGSQSRSDASTSHDASPGDDNVLDAMGTGEGGAPDGNTPPGPPAVSSISPNIGNTGGGTTVTITGTNFSEATALNFGGSAVTKFTVTSPTQITATSPPGSDGSTVDITVTTPLGTSKTSSADRFEWLIYVNVQGQVGLTSYTSRPIVTNNIEEDCSGCEGYSYWPGLLFWQSDPSSIYLDANAMAESRANVASLRAAGITAEYGLQTWPDVYLAIFPNPFPNEPSYVTADRASYAIDGKPAYDAYLKFYDSNPSYGVFQADGEALWSIYNTWTGCQDDPSGVHVCANEGWISPTMPMHDADCPPEKPTGCTWGDKFASLLATTSGPMKTGVFTVHTADGTDNYWASFSQLGFNPEIVSAFSAATGVSVPTTSAMDSWTAILSSATTWQAWVDWNNQQYMSFFNAMREDLEAANPGERSHIMTQGNATPANFTLTGYDGRLLGVGNAIPAANHILNVDNEVLNGDPGRNGDGVHPSLELYNELFAARAPAARVVSDLENIGSCISVSDIMSSLGLSQTQAQAYADGYLMHVWLYDGFAHIADTNGEVRMAMAGQGACYGEGGVISDTGTGAMDSVLRGSSALYPTRPFGPAYYYSVPAEQAITASGIAKVTNPIYGPYLPYPVAADFEAAFESGVSPCYFVSDAALPKVTGDSVPSAWLAIDAMQNGVNTLSGTEQSQLAATGVPVFYDYSTYATWLATHGPLRLSAGVTGCGFYDQNGALDILASNPVFTAQAQPITGASATFVGLADGTYTATDLLFPSTPAVTFTVTGGTGTLPLGTLAAWQTRLLSLVKQ